MKVAKVISIYLGPRRFNIDSKSKAEESISQLVEYEKNFDCGVPCDLILVDHTFNKEFSFDCLNKYNYQKTKNGTIKVIYRDWNDGIGMGFYSFIYAFDLLKYDYDYWFFSEDDILPLKENYIKEMIDIFESDSNIGFLGALNVKVGKNQFVFTESQFDENGYLLTIGGHPPYCPGAVGLTSTKHIQQVIHTYGEYPLCKLRMPDELQQRVFNNEYKNVSNEWESWYRYYVDNGEMPFTNVYTKLGYKIKIYSSGTEFKRIQWNDVC